MGALPKRKLGKSRKGKRRSHNALKARNLVACPNCRELRLPHQVCPWCGHYRGVEVVEIKTE
ncbi:MAG: 50S ribosomal protein L32 [Anaerolineae bacterium]